MRVIIKRDGRQVPFNSEKIFNAINKAFIQHGFENHTNEINKLIINIVSAFEDKELLSIEEIQKET